MTDRVKTAMPVGESGYTTAGNDADGWTVWDPFEQTPELRWPEAINVYSRMDNEDSRVASLLAAISLPILSTAWRIDPNNAPPEVAAFVSECMGLPLTGEDAPRGDNARTRGRFTWMEHLEEVASPTLQFGHSVFEQTYRRVGTWPNGWPKFEIRKLGARPQWTISKFNVARDGGLVSVEQFAAAGVVISGSLAQKPMPINRLVVYTRNKRPGVWQGKSILRSAYKHWLLKDKLLRIEAATAERNGMGVPVGTAANKDDAEVKAMAAVARGFRGGMSAGVGLAPGQILELLGVQGNLPDIRRAIDGHDRAIALSGLAHFLNLDGKGGSYALASVLADPFVQAVQAYAVALCRIGNAHIIEDLVDINFGTAVNSPKLVFDPIGSQQDLTAAAIKLLFDAGVFGDDPLVERAIRQRFGLPSAVDSTDDPEPEDPPVSNPTPAAPSQRSSGGRRAPAPEQMTLLDA